MWIGLQEKLRKNKGLRDNIIKIHQYIKLKFIIFIDSESHLYYAMEKNHT